MFSRSVLFVLVLGLLAACGGRNPGSSRPKTASDHFEIRLGDRTVRAQIAVLPEEMQRGLMHRKGLGEDEGMLFVFATPQQLGFWMRNTTVPLDIGYFDSAGVLREVYPLHPLDERIVRSRARDLKFALEMNQGWFAAKGVKPGAQLDVKAVATALRERELDPEAAGLR